MAPRWHQASVLPGCGRGEHPVDRPGRRRHDNDEGTLLTWAFTWWRGLDLNQRPSGYEYDSPRDARFAVIRLRAPSYRSHGRSGLPWFATMLPRAAWFVDKLFDGFTYVQHSSLTWRTRSRSRSRSPSWRSRSASGCLARRGSFDKLFDAFTYVQHSSLTWRTRSSNRSRSPSWRSRSTSGPPWRLARRVVIPASR